MFFAVGFLSVTTVSLQIRLVSCMMGQLSERQRWQFWPERTSGGNFLHQPVQLVGQHQRSVCVDGNQRSVHVAQEDFFLLLLLHLITRKVSRETKD